MKKKIVAAVVLALGISATGVLVTPVHSQTVTLGSIETRSALNQPLSVRIPLQGARDDLEVVLASNAVYARQGLDRAMLPPDLRVVVDGNAVVVTTDRPVREPYLPLLLEARWAGGQIIREYAILLDPPTVISQARAPVARVESPEPLRPPERVAAAPRAPAEPIGDQYVVQRGDTLFGIVQRWGFRGDELARAAVAAAQNNPDAFIDGDPNRMRTGVTLNRPTPEQVAALTQAQARAVLAGRPAEPEVQVAQAEAPAAPPAADAPAAEAAPSAPDDVASDEVVAEAAETAPSDDAGVPIDRLEIAAIEGGDGPLDLMEQIAARDLALEEAQLQLAQIARESEENLRLLELANADLARLEASLQALRGERAELQAQIDRLMAEINKPALERLMSDPLLMVMAGTSVLLLLLLLWSLARRREDHGAMPERADNSGVRAAPQPHAGMVVESTDAAETPPAGRGGVAPAGAMARASAAVAAGGAAGAAALGAHASDAPAGEANAARAVADVLAEVDVYLAYGMEEQALESLDRALAESPDEPELLLRRVDALTALGRQDDAHKALDALRSVLPAGDARVQEREQALAKQTGAPNEGRSDGPSAEGSDASGADGFGSALAEGDRVSGERGSDATTSGSLDDPLSFDVDEPPSTPESTRAEASSKSRTDAPSSGPDDDLDGLSFDFDDDASEASERRASSDADITFEDLDAPSPFDDSAASATRDDSVAGARDVDDDVFEFDDDGDRTFDAAAADASDDRVGGRGAELEGVEVDASDFDGEVDLRTRLDLARAYYEMEDREGAIELLDEILQQAGAPGVDPAVIDEARELRQALRESASRGDGADD